MHHSGLRLRLLGRLEVDGVDAARLGSRKARTLLTVLALARGAPVSPDRLAEILWGDEGPSQPRDQLSVLVSRLRSALGADILPRTRAGYALHVAWLDADALRELALEAQRRLDAGSPGGARTAAMAALSLVRGPLLADEPDAAWARSESEAAARMISLARQVGARSALATGDVVSAIELAQAARDVDPYDEAALRVVMAAYVAAGRRASALQAYEQLRERLADELGTDPSDATAAAHLAVLRSQSVQGVERTSAAMTAAEPGPAALSLPGRPAELQALDAALGRVTTGAFQLVTVAGEAGIGKTALLEVFAQRARRAGAIVLSGHCDELGRALPLQAILDALALHLRGLDAAETGRILGADRARLGPLLAHKGGGLVAPAGALGAFADPDAARTVLFGAILGALERITAEAPTVLLIEDVHLASATTAEWLGFVHRRSPRAPLLAVVSRRTGEGPDLAASTSIELKPLDLASAALVVGERDAVALHARSGGNPLFLTELARAEPGEALPASLRDAVAVRCERLGAAAATLRAAAILGSDVDVDLCAAVLGADPLEVLGHLEEGVQRAFLEERGAGFVFHHELVREALVAGTGVARRALLHRHAARVLIARPVVSPLVVAQHARLGGDVSLAARALVDAAAIAGGREDHAEADRLLSESIALADTAGARVARARARLRLTRMVDAERDAAVARRMGAGADAIEALAWAVYYQRQLARVLPIADEGAAEAADPEVRLSCLLAGARARHGLGDLIGAERRLETALGGAANEDVGPRVVLGLLRAQQGRAAEALALCARGSVEDVSAHLFADVLIHFVRASARSMLGRTEEALADLDAADRQIVRLDAARYRGRSDNWRGWILRNLGDLARADEHNLSALETARGVSFTETQAQALLDLAHGRLAAGDPEAAAARLVELDPLDAIEHAFQWRMRLRRALLTARIDAALGRWDQVRAGALELAATAAASGVVRYEIPARLLAVRADVALGSEVDLTAADRLLAELDGCCGLEAWWLTAEVAAATGVDRWWQLAEQRAEDLCRDAGANAPTLRRYAVRTLERMRISPT